MLRTVAVVGASLAGLRTAESLRHEGFAGRIVLVGAEDTLPYDRPPLSKQFLRGEWDTARVVLRDKSELAALDLDLALGTRAVGLDVATKTLHLAGGGHVDADAVVVATGAHTWRPPGWELRGVFDLRTLDDARALKRALGATTRVVVVGAGFIGCEVAAAARHLGVEVDLVEALALPLARSLGEPVGSFLADLHRAHGVRVHLNAPVKELVGRAGAVRAVRLENGETLATDTVVVGLGVHPTTDWLAGSGLEIADGIVCDASCAAAPGIFAAGDVARWEYEGRLVRVEHWTNAVEQATYVARRLLDGNTRRAPYAPVPYFWSDHYDVKLQGAGLPTPSDEAEILAGTRDAHRFLVGYRRGNQLSGALAANWPRVFSALRRQLAVEPTWDTAMSTLEGLLEAPSPRTAPDPTVQAADRSR